MSYFSRVKEIKKKYLNYLHLSYLFLSKENKFNSLMIKLLNFLIAFAVNIT